MVAGCGVGDGVAVGFVCAGVVAVVVIGVGVGWVVVGLELAVGRDTAGDRVALGVVNDAVGVVLSTA